MQPFSFHDLFTRASATRLTPEEKASMRRSLSAFIAAHPVSSGMPARHQGQRSQFIVNPFTRFLFKPSFKSMMIPLFLMLLLGAGGGVSFAAEHALPGDMLYPVKVSVNERVQSALAVSDEANSSWEVDRLERRLEESEKLVARENAHSTLADDADAKLNENFVAQADRVRERIAALQARGDTHAAAELSSDFEVALKVHERILARLAANQATETPGGVSALLVTVGNSGEAASAARKESELRVIGHANTQTQVAAQGRKKAAQKAIEEAENFLKKWQERLGVNATADAEIKLALAKTVFAQGQAKLDAGSANDAFLLFQKAHRLAHEAKLLVFARSVLHVDVALDADDADNMVDVHEDAERGKTNQVREGDDHDAMRGDQSAEAGGSAEAAEQTEVSDGGTKENTDSGTGFHLRLPRLFR